MSVLVTFGVGNRITIPASVVNELNLQTGMKLELNIQQDGILLSKVDCNFCTPQPSATNYKINKSSATTENITKRKIVSNLEEGQKFSKKYYSPCKLVIRTKNKYLKNFCEDCKGLLVENDIEKRNLCPYINIQEPTKCEQEEQTVDKPIQEQQKTTKQLKQDIESNVGVLNNILDTKINNINETELQQFNKQKQKVLQPVKSNSYYYQCNKCKQIFNKGFMLDDTFYCKNCTKQNFKQFLQSYINFNRGGVI